MTTTINHVWYCNFGNGTSTGYYAVAKWAASHAYTVGQIIRQLATPAVNNERCFICIVAGTSSGTEPTWVLYKGNTTTDNTVTWIECTGKPALNGDLTNTPTSANNRSGAQTLGYIITDTGLNYFICTTAGTTGSSSPTFVTTVGGTTTDSGCTWTCIGTISNFTAWMSPQARIQTSLQFSVSGDTHYVSSVHAETQTGSILFASSTSLYASILCIPNSTIPPTTLAIGATVSATGTSGQITLSQGANYIQGISFTAYNYIYLISSPGYGVIVVNCILNLVGTTNYPGIVINQTSGTCEFINTKVTLSNYANTYFNITGGPFIWRDTPSAISSSPLIPYFIVGSGVNLFEGIDFSGYTGSTLLSTTAGGTWVLNGCKLPTTFSVAAPYGSTSYYVLDIINCDSGGLIYRHERWNNYGTHIIDVTAVHTGGSSDGSTPISWKILTNSYPVWITPFECMPITIWNTVTGSTVNVTLQGLYNGSTLPNNNGIWMDVRYFATASSTLLTCNTGTIANILTSPTAQTASTAAWDSVGTARINSHAYTIGNYITLSGNPGQLFICTTAGTSSSSLPGTYTSVADGTSVTDGTAVFNTLVRFSMTATLSSPTPQSAGYIKAYVRAALPSSTFWIDPLITLH